MITLFLFLVSLFELLRWVIKEDSFLPEEQRQSFVDLPSNVESVHSRKHIVELCCILLEVMEIQEVFERSGWIKYFIEEIISLIEFLLMVVKFLKKESINTHSRLKISFSAYSNQM